ncbi:MAG: hypothetical protein H6627_13620 [Calditrichae bacterium]|nr:hypothetical protein [Calditrichota bacterium]MCB9059606.1 hypothetical protein [Calditrichia bacterium]
MEEKKKIEVLLGSKTVNPEEPHPDVVSHEELVAILMVKTGKSEAVVRQVLSLFNEYISKELSEKDSLLVKGSEEFELLFKRLDLN